MSTPVYANPYEKIWQTRDLSALDKPIEIDNKMPEWQRGLGAFGKEMQGTGYGIAALGSQAVENVIGENPVTKGITDWGLKGYNQSMEESQSGLYKPSVANIEDIKNASDLGNWASYQLGKGIPMLASLAASGGVGGAVARLSANQGVKQLAKAAVGDIVKKTVAEKAVQATEGQVVNKALQEAAKKALMERTLAGATVGAYTGSFGLEGGQAFGEETRAGIKPADAVKSAIAVGGINAALELLPVYNAAKKIGMGEYAKQSIKQIIEKNPDLAKRAVALAGEVGRRAGSGAAEGVITEGITEGLQELTNVAGMRWAKNDPLFASLSDDEWSQVKNATAAGALVGGVAAGAVSPFSGPRTQQKPTTTPPPTGEIKTKTKLQELEEGKAKLDAALAAAQTEGDVEKIAEIQAVKDLYEKAIEKAKAGEQTISEKPVVEEAAIETPSTVPVSAAETPVTKVVPTEAPAVEAPSTVEVPPVINTEQPGQDINALIKAQEDNLARLGKLKEDLSATGKDTTDVDTAIVQEEDKLKQLSQGVAPVENAPAVETQPTSETPPVIEQPTNAAPAPIQLKQGESVELTPGAAPRVVPTQQETENLQKLMGERPAKNEGNAASQDIRYSKPLSETVTRESAPTFYSALERAAQEINQQKAPAHQWAGTLDSLVKKGLVKQEELDWSGTKEWLQEQKGPVTKEALLQHVRDNTVEAQEANPNPRNTNWTEPGGQNQRELVLTVPSIEPFNTDDTTHYGDVGGGRAVAWVRFNDRVDGDGKKTLFLEEVQSKRHQEGKGSGYADYEPLNKLRKDLDEAKKILENNNLEEKNDWANLAGSEGRGLSKDEIATLYKKYEQSQANAIEQNNKVFDLIKKIKETESKLIGKVPDAPFKQTIAGSGQTLSGWAGLVFKRMLRYAAENGYDKVAWTTGEQQVERYNLAKHVQTLQYSRDTERLIAYGKNNEVILSRNVPEENVKDYIGKELAEKLLSQKESNRSGVAAKRLEGTDLKIGGEGMKGFYDKLLPSEINKYVKKWGATVSTTQIEFGDKTKTVHSVDITPAMRDSVMQGQPLFSKEQATESSSVKITPEELRSNIDSIMEEGGWTQKAEALGLIEIIDGPGPNGESGSWIGGKIRLYTGSVPANGSPSGVLLHEGEHHTFNEVLGKALPSYVKDLRTLADNGNKIAQNAISHATIITADLLGIKHNLRENGNKSDLNAVRALIEQQRPGLLAEEELAYFVQYGADAQTGTGFWRRLVNQIKAWFAQTRLGQRMKELGIGFELTDGMAVEWAKMGLNRSIAKLQQEAQVRARVLQEAANLPASERLGRALAALEQIDPLYSFAGKNALTANLSMLEQAELRLKQGEDKETVRKETGWHQGADGKWRFEIDDSKASFNFPFEEMPESELFKPEQVILLEDVLDHPDLFAAYPQIRKISVIKRPAFMDFNSAVQGWFNDTNLQLGITPYTKNPMSTLLHEIQHVIQMYEGFAKGGNENSVWAALPIETKENIAKGLLEKIQEKQSDVVEELDIIAKASRLEGLQGYINEYLALKKVSDTLWSDPTMVTNAHKRNQWSIAHNKTNSFLDSVANLFGVKRALDFNYPQQRAFNRILDGVNLDKDRAEANKRLAELINKATKIRSGDEEIIRKEADLFEFYRRLAGETEARLTQARMGMRADERQQVSPESMQDYPYEQQIVVGQDGKQTESNILYSMGIKELREQLWTDPTDVRQELVNKPGLLQKFRSHFIDFFSDMEKKSKDIYDTYSLLRSKKAARIEQARQEYYIPLRTLIANSPWTPQEVGDMLAARHIKIDKVNIDLAERASSGFVADLAKNLTDVKRKALLEGRKNILDGKMPDGKEYLDATGNLAQMSSRTMRKLMFDLMNKYAPLEQKNPDGLQEIREEWEIFKDAAGGFSDGGVAAGKVRTVDSILEGINKDKAKFTQIANLFDAMNRHVLDILEDGHLITPQEHARLVMDKSAYAPLRRESYKFDQEVENLFRRAGQGGSKQIATRTGTAALSEPTLVLQNALAKVEAAAAAAERNLANTELYEVISKDKAGWKPWFSIVDKDKYVTHDENGFLSEKNATGSSPADIVLIKDGKRLIVRPNMHNGRATGFVRAVNNLDAQELTGPMKVLGGINQLVRAVNITFSPVFLMRNAIMDPFTAAYNMQASEAAKYTGDIFNNYGRAFKALKKVFLDGNRDPNDDDVKAVEEWENAGGRASFIDSLKQMDDTWRGFDAQVARRQGSMKYLMGVKDKWVDGIENFNLLFENVMRFSTFQTLVKNKVDKKQAARISQDLTTNFTRRGYKTQMLGTWWLFFNASVQGNYQVVRNLISSPRLQALAGGTIAMAVMLDLLGRALAPDDWDKIPEWDKERYIIMPVKIGGDFIKIPAPWVYNTLWRAGGMMGEVIAGKRKVQDMALDLAALSATALSPMGKPGSIAQAIAPTAADPFVQILENKDFSGNPIGPEGYPGASKKANSELLWGNTPKGYQSFARFVNEATGGSAAESGAIDLRPSDYQILARFLTGSLGRFLSDSTFGFGKDVKKGIEGPKDVPIIREFFSDPYDPISVQKYHTNIASIYGAHRLERMYMAGPDRDLIKLQEVRTERGKELQMYNQAQDVERQLKSLRTRLRAAQNREDFEREKELKKKMEAVQNQFNTAYKQKVG